MISSEYELFCKNLFSAPKPTDLTIPGLRANLEKLLSRYTAKPDVSITPCQLGSISGFWIKAPNADPQKVILFFHGGGYVAGSPKGHQDHLGRLSAASGCSCLAIVYRLAPEHPYPAALEDAYSAYQWLLDHNYHPNQIAFAGNSAGAGLALALLLKLTQEKKPLPSCAYLGNPWIDLTMSGESLRTNEGKDILSFDRLDYYRHLYAGKTPLTDSFISPLLGDLKGLPPLFIQTGTRDLLYSEALTLAEKARKAGVKTELDVWPEMIHSFSLFAKDFPEGQKAIQRAGEFISSNI